MFQIFSSIYSENGFETDIELCSSEYFIIILVEIRRYLETSLIEISHALKGFEREHGTDE